MATRKPVTTAKATTTRKQTAKAKTKTPREQKAPRDQKPLREQEPPRAKAAEKPEPPVIPADKPSVIPAPPTQAPPQREKLVLPKGALVALRKSTGNPAEMREVIVFPDGRVTYDTHQKPDQRRPRKLSDANIAEISHTLDRTGFFRLESTAAEPSDDKVLFEIAARRGNRTNHVEYLNEAAPDSLTPLVDRLTPLLPPE